MVHNKWTEKEIRWLKRNFQTHTTEELAAHLKRTHASVKSKCGDLKLAKTKEALSAIYSRPNPGHYKKGGVPHNTRHDYNISIRADKRGNIYKWIRTGLNQWEPLHRYLWQQAGNTIPAGHCLVFKDRNPLNCVLQNLEVITRAENGRRNRLSYLQKKESQPVTRAMLKRERIKRNKEAVQLNKKLLREQKRQEQRERMKRKREAVLLNKKLQRQQQRQQQRKQKAQQQIQQAKPVKKETPVLAMRHIDYSTKKAVRIDRKTIIYIEPHQDAEAVRMKYLQRMQKAI